MRGSEYVAWAEQEFGQAQLGDTRRTKRLVAMAAKAAANPNGKVTAVFDDGAEREGAFRLLENEDAAPDAVATAAHAATARRCDGEPYVWVPLDGSSLNITDRTGKKGLGVVGARSIGAQGLCVMSAIAVARNGTPLGLCGQRFWARKNRSTRRARKKDTRRLEEKETRYWLDVINHVEAVFAEHAPGTRPWHQLDRGGDAWPVLLDAWQQGRLVTVRAAHDRRIVTDDNRKRYLWEQVRSQPVAAIYELEIPSGVKRTARTARLSVQFSPVRLDLRDLRTKRHHHAVLQAVLVRELDSTPDGEEPLEWMLLTTAKVENAHDALMVLAGYSQRWRIEEFHKVWKTGACRVEETQLRADDHIARWATILASVAMRLLRLTYLARRTPDAPATVELSDAEVQAVLLLRNPPNTKPREIPRIADAVRWIAELGGYTGKSSGGPPGPLVLARGLHRIEPLAAVIAAGRVRATNL